MPKPKESGKGMDRAIRAAEIKGRAHYFADRQEITLSLHNDICWLVEEHERLRSALEEIVYGLWGDMTPRGIAASMKVIAESALAEECPE